LGAQNKMPDAGLLRPLILKTAASAAEYPHYLHFI
jgi:hypothetical protein